jgi:hypothetical protein
MVGHMKYCQGPSCHTYESTDRIRGQKGDNCLCYYDVDADTGNKYRTAVNYEVLA